jgi:hypothetical protein
MSLDVLSELNWLAVLVATIAWFALGGLWYANGVLGRAWNRADGSQRPEGQGYSPAFYIVPLITCFLGALATAMLAAATGGTTMGDGLMLGLVVGVACAAVVLVLSLTRPQPTAWFLISGGYQLLGLLLVGVIVTVWD